MHKTINNSKDEDEGVKYCRISEAVYINSLNILYGLRL